MKPRVVYCYVLLGSQAHLLMETYTVFEIPEIGCLVAADERFHLEFDRGLLLIDTVMIQ